MLLTFYVREIEFKIILLGVKFRTRINYGRLQWMHTIKMSYNLVDVSDTIYFKFINNGCFANVIFGYKKPFVPHLSGLNSYRKRSFNRH